MRTLLIALFVMLTAVFLVLLFKLPQQGTYNLRVVPPPGADEAVLLAHLTSYAASEDWATLLRDHELAFSTEALGQLLAPLQDGELTGARGLLTLSLKFKVSGITSAGGGIERLQMAAAFIEHRLQVEAWLCSYPQLDAAARQQTAWRLLAAGFPALFEDFLVTRTPSETDPATRALLRALTGH